MRPVIPLLALALLAGMVTGREQPAAPERFNAAPPRFSQQSAAAVQELELDRLVRQRQERTFTDIFSTHSPPPAEPAPPPAAAPAPVQAAAPTPPAAPQLPFAYLGRMVNGERIVAYVLKGEQMYLAEAGQTLGDDYRVEGVTDSAVHFVYLPLGTEQVLSFPVRE